MQPSNKSTQVDSESQTSFKYGLQFHDVFDSDEKTQTVPSNFVNEAVSMFPFAKHIISNIVKRHCTKNECKSK